MNQLAMNTEVVPIEIGVSHRQATSLWNAQGGLQIRWSADLDEYTSTTGDRLVAGTVEERVRHLLARGEGSI